MKSLLVLFFYVCLVLHADIATEITIIYTLLI